MAEKTITVIHLHNSRSIGGVEVSLTGWMRYFDRRQINPLLFLFEEADGSEKPFLAYLNRRNIPVTVLPWGRKKRLIAALRHLIRVIRASQPCIVHTHDMRPDFVGGLAAKLTGCAFIASNHGWHSIWDGIGAKRRRNDVQRSWFLKLCDLQIAVADSVRKESLKRGANPDRVIALLTGIDRRDFTAVVARLETRQRLGFAESDIVIGNIARLYPEKAQALLIEAFAEILPERPAAQLLIVGDGPLLSSLQALVNQREIVSRVRFLPFQDDIASIYGALDIFALPSFSEGAPLALYKAIVSGLPLVASHVAGNSELIAHGKTGLLVPPGDVEALKAALLCLTSADGELRNRLGDGAQRAARDDPRFSIEESARSLQTIYRNVVR